jgi:hypothetical protein
MKSKRGPRAAWFMGLVMGALVVVGQGCSLGSGNAPVNAGKARETLRAAMDSWKRGDKVDALQSATPRIYVIDLEWQDGAKLADFQIVGEGVEKDAQFYCPVRLTIRDANGQEATREVTYMVSTAPNLTVSRKLF